MFDSISNIFSLPPVSRNKYKDQPSLRSFLNKKKELSVSNKEVFKSTHFDNLIQCLQKPLEDWILQHESTIKTSRANKLIFNLTIENSKKGQLTEQQESKISVHNLFVLMVQYDVLSGFLKQMEMSDLQLLVDGACGIILKDPNDSMEELTCVLHHILTKCFMNKKQKGVKELRCIYRALEISNIPNFIKVYDQLPQKLNNNFYDTVVRVIPMFVELLKLISLTDKREEKSTILKKIQWIQDIPSKLLYLICSNIDQILKHKEDLETISFENDYNPNLKMKLVEEAKKIIANQDASGLLFKFATRQLYYFQHVLRLQKFMMRLTKGNQKLEEQQQQLTLYFIEQYLKAIIKYEVTIPQNHFTYLQAMLKLTKFETRFEILHLIPEYQTQNFQTMIKSIEQCPIYQWRNEQITRFEAKGPSFLLSTDQNILTFLLTKIYNFQLNYLKLVIILFQKINRNFLHPFQYYLIKNNFLQFLLKQENNIQGHQKNNIELFFTIVSQLIKESPIAHCIMDQSLKVEVQQNSSSTFHDSIRKYFIYSKSILITVLSDSIRTNIRNQESGYFLPYSLQLLFYPQGKNNPKHDIWISYIHDVIVRDLKKTSQRLQHAKHPDSSIQRDIQEWITIAIMIQIEYVMFKRGRDLQLGEFTMNYMTSILKEAIKWQYEDETSVMKRILSNYQEWENYYTEVILTSENNEDVIENMLGPSVNFLFLKRWNKKITNSINIFIETVLTTQVADLSIDQIKKLK